MAYVLLLSNGQFVDYEEVNEHEFDIVPSNFESASVFNELELSEQEAETINRGYDSKAKYNSSYKVVSVLRICKNFY